MIVFVYRTVAQVWPVCVRATAGAGTAVGVRDQKLDELPLLPDGLLEKLLSRYMILIHDPHRTHPRAR